VNDYRESVICGFEERAVIGKIKNKKTKKVGRSGIMHRPYATKSKLDEFSYCKQIARQHSHYKKLARAELGAVDPDTL